MAPVESTATTRATYAYLYRLSSEARLDGAKLAGAVSAAIADGGKFADETSYGGLSITRTFHQSLRPWGGGGSAVPVFEYEVKSGSFTMSAESPALDRAVEFAGIYLRLQSDLRRVLSWSWL